MWVVVIFVTIPLGNEIRDWLLLARKPAEARRYELAKDAFSLTSFPLVSHRRAGFTAFEFENERLHVVSEYDVPHDHAVLIQDRLCVTRDDVLEVYRYRKGQSLERLLDLELRAKPVELIASREPLVAVRFKDGVMQVIDPPNVWSELRPAAPVLAMGNLVWQLALVVTNGVVFWSPEAGEVAGTNTARTIHLPTETTPTMIAGTRGRILLGESSGSIQELRRTGDRFEIKRSARLPAAPIAVHGTKFALSVACSNGALATLDWRNESKLALAHVSKTRAPFASFQFYADQGFALLDPRTLVQFNPTPGNRLAIQIVAVALAGSGGCVLLWLLFKRRERSWWRYAVLFAVGIVYALNLKAKWSASSPIEAIHYLEYGVLGVLAARALRHHLDDWGVYPVGFLVVTLIGMADEVYQWIHPARTEDLDDVLLNMKSGGLMLAAFAFGAPLRGQASRFGARSRRVFGWLMLPLAIGLGLFIQFLSQFGHEVRAPDGGIMVSRFPGDALRRLDTERGVDLGRRLQGIAELPYEESLKLLEGEWFLYELRVHLFRRDVHFNRAGYFVAYKENQILSHYFSNTVARTSYRWDTPQIQKCLSQLGDEQGRDYRSPVSAQLITRFGPANLWSVVALIAAACGFLVFRTRSRS